MRRREEGEGGEGEGEEKSSLEGSRRKRKTEALRAVQEAYQRALLRRAKDNGATIVDEAGAAEQEHGQEEEKKREERFAVGHNQGSKQLRQQIHDLVKKKQELEHADPPAAALANSLKVK